jgi:hypothetical protein
VAGDARKAPWTDITVNRVEAALSALLAGRSATTGGEPVPRVLEPAWP